ncbi:MAG: RNA polymerase sigma factor (sigma-70 family) [Pirellulaceae bacterium]|jgi:RNA polymerase sigma factor (sigma-70 family)
MENHSEDPTATWLQAIVRQYEVPLVRYATRIVGDVERARDIVQDSFLKLCREPRERVEPVVGRWLYTVCRNRAFDIRKKESRMKAISDERARGCESREPSQAVSVEQQDSFGQAVRFLNELPEKQCEAIRLRIQTDSPIATLPRSWKPAYRVSECSLIRESKQSVSEFRRAKLVLIDKY